MTETPQDQKPDQAASQRLCLDPDGGLPRLLEIMARLRHPETGCPWDIEQDFSSIVPYTIEEAHEVADAIERRDWPELEGELGDLLLQVVYYTQMGAESGLFDFASVTRAIADKMISRHPHVFGSDSRDKSATEQTRDWEKLKAGERAARGDGKARVLDGVALGLPPLTRAVKLQKRAARVGFDWPETTDVLDKLTEECAELAEASKTGKPADMAEEFGDILFVMANLARHLGIDPDAALRGANSKFVRRFQLIEDELAKRGKTPETSDLAEMDSLWNQAKIKEKRPGG